MKFNCRICNTPVDTFTDFTHKKLEEIKFMIRSVEEHRCLDCMTGVTWNRREETGEPHYIAHPMKTGFTEGEKRWLKQLALPPDQRERTILS